MRLTALILLTLFVSSTDMSTTVTYPNGYVPKTTFRVHIPQFTLFHNLESLPFWKMMNAQDRYDSLFQYYAEQHGLDWLLLKAQVRAESNFDAKAVSHAGAMGLAQFMPATWRDVMGEDIPTNPEAAIRAQCKYMKALLDQFGELEWALAAYNWGPGRVRNLRARKRGSFYELTSEMPQETVTYVDRILTFHEQYKEEV